MPELTHLEEIRDRYAIERARRLRAEAAAQYEYDDLDPSIDPAAERIERSALRDEVDVAIIGAGLSGLTTAVKLRQAGIERIRLIDRAGDVGGTWYWNRYPAAQCDVESYIYMPLLEDMNYVPTEKYAFQTEIFPYCQAVARKFDLYRDACFHTDVLELAWNDVDGMWSILTDQGDAMRAQFLVVAGGFLQRPKLPGTAGMADFRGKVFHSSRWDYSYTGGYPSLDGGGLPNLHDKKVGVVGTGASGLQIVRPLAEAAQHVYVFQRTPSVVLPRNNRPTDPEWAGGLKPGWQTERMESFNRRGNGILDGPDLVADSWTKVVVPVIASHGAGLFGGPEERKQAELVDLAAMDAVRQRVAEIVRDPETAAALMPQFRMLCKRPGFHDEYLDSFNRPNVTLVDTRGVGLEKVTATGVVARGREYEVDCLIMATGFDTARGLLRTWGVDLVGKNGMRLTEYWKAGMRTLHGVHVHNFPNCFFHSTTQTAGSLNYGSNVVEVSKHISYTVAKVRKEGCRRVETSGAAEEAWVQTIKSAVPDTHLEFFRSCTPGYYNNEGNLDDVNRLGANNFMGGSALYFDILRNWRKDDALDGLELGRD